jgi:hypothetical protein
VGSLLVILRMMHYNFDFRQIPPVVFRRVLLEEGKSRNRMLRKFEVV